MPVVIVTAPELASDAASAALRAVNSAASSALQLPAAAVHSMLVPSVAACTGTSVTTPWPTAVLHGRAREADAMMRAVEAVAAALSSHWRRPVDEVWVQWATNG